HKILGPGLLERVYEVCFCHELSKRGLNFNVSLIKKGIQRIII
ncbi:MAG: GxxExxY protein, partial [Syntrophobacterales bacterium CG23_combo_of_CG06-09_8_20_14_all_48_27]